MQDTRAVVQSAHPAAGSETAAREQSDDIIGVSRRVGYHSPYQTILDYLGELDAAGVPKQGRLLAALGPRVTRVAGERTAGAHPFMTTPAHTSQARAILGAGPLLAPEQKVVLSTDAGYARGIARQRFGQILKTVNYRNSGRWRLVIDSLSSEDIAQALFISVHTVRDHVKAIFGKVGVSSRHDLVATLAGNAHTR